MKKILLTLTLMITLTAFSQDLADSQSQKEVITKTDVLIKNTDLKFFASKFFTEENKFVVKYANGEEYVLFIFNYIKEDNGDRYMFNYTSGNDKNLKLIWKSNFSSTNFEKHFDKQNNVVYYLAEDNDDKWIIKKL